MRSSVIKIIVCLAIFPFLMSCKETRKQEVERLTKEWYGKEIVFPKGMTATIMGDNTVAYSDSDYEKTTRKIVFYADSLGCASCDLNLLEWMDFMEAADSITRHDISFFFYFAPEKERDIIWALKLDGFTAPVFIDSEKKFDALNRLPENQLFRTFLLDKDNKIILIGNPTHGMEKLYFRVLSENH